MKAGGCRDVVTVGFSLLALKDEIEGIWLGLLLLPSELVGKLLCE